MVHPPRICCRTVSLGFRGGQPARRRNRPARTHGLPLTGSPCAGGQRGSQVGASECVSEQHTSDNRAIVPKCYSEELALTKTGEGLGRIRGTDLKHPDAGDIPTPRGGTWAPMQVKNILDRSSNYARSTLVRLVR